MCVKSGLKILNHLGEMPKNLWGGGLTHTVYGETDASRETRNSTSSVTEANRDCVFSAKYLHVWPRRLQARLVFLRVKVRIFIRMKCSKNIHGHLPDTDHKFDSYDTLPEIYYNEHLPLPYTTKLHTRKSLCKFKKTANNVISTDISDMYKATSLPLDT